jgi:hypothetical protein
MVPGNPSPDGSECNRQPTTSRLTSTVPHRAGGGIVRSEVTAMTEDDAPDDDERDPLVELFGEDEEDERPRYVPTWLGAISQLTGALLIVLALIAAFIVAVIVFRRAWP